MHGELPARYDLLRRALQGGRFGYQHQVRNKLTAAPEVARGGGPLQSELRLAQVCFRSSEQRSGAMQMARAFTPHLEPAKNFGLQRGSQSLHRLEPIMQRGLLQLLYRGDAKLSVELEDLVRPQAGDAQHLEDPGGDFQPHRLELWMCAGAMQAHDDARDGLTHARNLAQPALGDDVSKGHRQSRQALSRTHISARAIRIAAAQRHALAELVEQLGDCGSVVGGCHGSVLL